MNIISVPAEESKLNALLESARENSLILETADGQRFVLMSLQNWIGFDVGNTDDFAEEVRQTGQNKELMEFLVKRRQNAERISLADVKAEIGE